MKMIRFVAAALIAVMLLSFCALAEVKTIGNVNLRTGPGLSYDVLTSVSKGKTLTYLKKTSTDDRGIDWYLVNHNDKECWISSVYSEVVGEPVVYEQNASLPDLNNIRDFTELSTYYRQDLKTAAAELNLTDFTITLSEVPNEYSNDVLAIAGNNNVEYIGFMGGDYTLFGAAIGMNVQNASMIMTANGLKLISVFDNQLLFGHPADDESGVNIDGFDSSILVETDADTVFAVTWNTYTG